MNLVEIVEKLRGVSNFLMRCNKLKLTDSAKPRGLKEGSRGRKPPAVKESKNQPRRGVGDADTPSALNRKFRRPVGA